MNNKGSYLCFLYIVSKDLECDFYKNYNQNSWRT